MVTGNDVNEAISTLAKDAMLQKVRSIAITYSDTNGDVHSFTFIPPEDNRYSLIGMIDDLKNEAYKHFTQDEEDDE